MGKWAEAQPASRYLDHVEDGHFESFRSARSLASGPSGHSACTACMISLSRACEAVRTSEDLRPAGLQGQ